MFFADRIKNILPTDSVLEIGPGAHPHPRSNVLLELEYQSEEERNAQFGHAEKLMTNKKIVLYNGKKFPFKDKEFDYVICSHVLEHVDDVPAFLSEIFRVSSKGYFEYPLVYYDYLYNYDVHPNFLKYDAASLKYMKKKDTSLNDFKVIQELLALLFQKGHTAIVDTALPLFMEGFEWDKPFPAEKARSIAEVCHKDFKIPEIKKEMPPKTWQLFKQLIRSIIK